MWNTMEHRVTHSAASRWSLACSSAVAIALFGAAGCAATMDDPATTAEGTDSLDATGAGEQLFVHELAADTSSGVTTAASLPVGWSVHATRSPVIAIHPTGVGTVELFGGTTFLKGDWVQWNKARLIMQSDGNLVVYDENLHARWASNTVGAGARTAFQTDANLVVYNASNQPIRNSRVPSNTCCHTGWTLNVQSDGNVVIYAPNWVPEWATHTNH